MIIKGLKENILYHYTSYATFQSIVENRQIWLTDCDFVEDTKEIKFGFDFMDAKIDERFSHEKEHIFFSALLDIRRQQEKHYIFCLCPNPNNQHLWNKYARRHTGVAIGFDAEYFVSHFSTRELEKSYASIFNVSYDLEKFERDVSTRISALELPAINAINRQWIVDRNRLHQIPNYTNAQQMIVQSSVDALMLKDPKYILEDEWRLMHKPLYNLPLDIRIELGKPRAIIGFEGGLPIKKVLCGKNMKRDNIKGVQELLKTYRYI